MDFKGENIQMWFKYKWKEGVSDENKKATMAMWDKMNAYFKSKKAFGPILMNLSFVATDDGWEGYETFVDAAAYELHAANTMSCPFIEDVFAS